MLPQFFPFQDGNITCKTYNEASYPLKGIDPGVEDILVPLLFYASLGKRILVQKQVSCPGGEFQPYMIAVFSSHTEYIYLVGEVLVQAPRLVKNLHTPAWGYPVAPRPVLYLLYREAGFNESVPIPE